jgi:hypothetical protein
MERIDRTVVVDLDTEQVLGDSGTPGKPGAKWLLMARPTVPWEQIAEPVVRFYSGGQRVLTIPVAVDLR